LKNGRIIVTFLITLVLIISVLNTAIAFGLGVRDGRDGDQQSEVIIIHKEVIDMEELYEEESYDVIEEYESFIIVKVSEEDKNTLQEKGAAIENLENRDLVTLNSYSFNTRYGEPVVPENLEIDEYTEGERGYYIVQFIGPIKNEWKEKLETKDVELHEFRHRFNYIVRMKPEIRKTIEDKEFVNWVGLYHPAYRIDQNLLEKSNEVCVDISLFDSADIEESARVIEHIGGEIEAIRGNRITAEIHSQRLEKIANIAHVKSVTEGNTEYHLFNEDATWIAQTNEQDYRKVTEKGVTGEGEQITVMDSELYMEENGVGEGVHEAWEDPENNSIGDDHRKVQEWYVPGDAGGHLEKGVYHGTHVTGSVLGETPPYGEYSNHDGNALEARVVFQDISDCDYGTVDPPTDMYNDGYGEPYDWGSRVHTNSWGGGSGYGSDAITADEFVWDNKDFNILYAMGNDGSDPNTLSEQAEGKNVLSIGAARNAPFQDQVAGFSSRGYADDGRIKPTLLHIGQSLYSADRSEDGYNIMSGTSMSTPGIAGQVGQIRQYYEEGWHISGNENNDHGFNPSNALVRATLINGAVEISGDGAYENDERFPNNDQGFGRSKLDRVLYFEGDDRRLEVFDSLEEGVELETGESWEMEIDVEDPSQELEVTLAWSDYPGSQGSDENDPAIVNDLDLEIKTPNETKYVGNAFVEKNPGYSESDPTDNPWSGLRDGKYDGLNVEENVLLLPDENNLEAGTYKINVTAHNVPEGEQPFAVVVSGGLKGGPVPPVDPEPKDGSTEVDTEVNLSVKIGHDDGENMDVTFYNASDNSTIGTDYDVACGDYAEVTWSDLAHNTTYEWYAKADDGEENAQSEKWFFVTEQHDEAKFEVTDLKVDRMKFT